MADDMDGDHSTDIMDFDLEDFEEDLASGCSNADSGFDTVIGHIEDIVMEDEFQRLQNSFQEKYYREFEDSEENKFIYTDIHREYVQLVEKFLGEEITNRLPDFSMEEFLSSLELKEGESELEGEIFDLLRTFSDFLKFKEFMLDYREDKEGRTIDLSNGIMVTPVHDDMQMEGAGLSLTGQSFRRH